MDYYEIFLEYDGKRTYLNNYVDTLEGESVHRIAKQIAKMNKLEFRMIKQLLVIPSEKYRVVLIKKRWFRRPRTYTFLIRKRAINRPWDPTLKVSS